MSTNGRGKISANQLITIKKPGEAECKKNRATKIDKRLARTGAGVISKKMAKSTTPAAAVGGKDPDVRRKEATKNRHGSRGGQWKEKNREIILLREEIRREGTGVWPLTGGESSHD